MGSLTFTLRGDRASHLATLRLMVRAEPSRRWKVGELATAAQLSPRRFRELFSGQIGISCRQYLLWSHLSAALTQLASGAALTEAALAAGFADAAHLTRTFRRMVGIVPSAIAFLRSMSAASFC